VICTHEITSAGVTAWHQRQRQREARRTLTASIRRRAYSSDVFEARVELLGDADDDARARVLDGDALDAGEDAELQELVTRANRDLHTAWALVTLLLRRRQLLRASTGIPPELALTRTIHRGAAFCQQTMLTGAPYAVIDARLDPQVPQELVRRFGVRSYLGAPITVGRIAVGALCVFDVRPRVFAAADIERLTNLAALASTRVQHLASVGRNATYAAAELVRPAFGELRAALDPLCHDVGAARTMIEQLTAAVAATGDDSTLQLERLRGALARIADATARLQDTVASLETVIAPRGDVLTVAEMVRCATGLTHHATQPVGGVRWQNTAAATATAVRSSRTVAVVLLGGALSLVAIRMQAASSRISSMTTGWRCGVKGSCGG